MAITAFLSRSPVAAQPGTWGTGLSGTCSLFQHRLSNWSEIQLIWTSCHRGYSIIWLQSSSCERHNFALNSTPRQSRSYPDIPRPDAPVIYTGAFPILTAWPGRRSIYNTYISCLYNLIFYVYFFWFIFYHFTPKRVFRLGVSWRFLTGVWMIANLLKSPGLFAVF